MAAVPRTAATWTTALRQTEQQFRGNQREPTYQCPAAAVAALPALGQKF